MGQEEREDGMTCNYPMMPTAGGGHLYCTEEKGHEGRHTHTFNFSISNEEPYGLDFKLNVYTDAVRIAHSTNQVVGAKKDYYVTLEQLETILETRTQAVGRDPE